MLGHLAQQTHHLQIQSDEDRLSLLGRDAITLDAYRAYLGKIYVFEAPIETALVATPGLEPRLLRNHLKASCLAADLEALGVPARAELLPSARFESVAQALGWLYVLHRNTFVHGVIAREVGRQLPGTLRASGAYLRAVEGRAGALMAELGAALDRTARQVDHANEITTAARDALRLQRQWYRFDVLVTPGPAPARAQAGRRAVSRAA